jgi:hypothetical protein
MGPSQHGHTPHDQPSEHGREATPSSPAVTTSTSPPAAAPPGNSDSTLQGAVDAVFGVLNKQQQGWLHQLNALYTGLMGLAGLGVQAQLETSGTNAVSLPPFPGPPSTSPGIRYGHAR